MLNASSKYSNSTLNLSSSSLKYLTACILILNATAVYAEAMNLIDPTFPPEISAKNDADKQYVKITNSSNIYNIKMGKLDKSCPPKTDDNPDCTQSGEPGTYLYVKFPVNTKGGGKFTFKYRLQTYDDSHGGDYANIAVYEPGSKEKKYLVKYLRSANYDNGTLWDSGYKTITIDMDPWKNKIAKYYIEFYLTLDGQGDQSLLEISEMQALGCDVIPLKPLTDEESLYFENVNDINTEKLNAATKAGWQCMTQKAIELGGTFNLSSGYRPLPYQQHIYDVWWAHEFLMKSQQPKSYCSTLTAQIKKELKRHKLVTGPAKPKPNAPHVIGNAIDGRTVKINMPIDDFAKLCEMYRRMIILDPVHFEPIKKKSWALFDFFSFFRSK